MYVVWRLAPAGPVLPDACGALNRCSAPAGYRAMGTARDNGVEGRQLAGAGAGSLKLS
jgi:hypothetical protein